VLLGFAGLQTGCATHSGAGTREQVPQEVHARLLLGCAGSWSGFATHLPPGLAYSGAGTREQVPLEVHARLLLGCAGWWSGFATHLPPGLAYLCAPVPPAAHARRLPLGCAGLGSRTVLTTHLPSGSGTLAAGYWPHSQQPFPARWCSVSPICSTSEQGLHLHLTKVPWAGGYGNLCPHF
jgi:hypothetical protein